MLLSHTLPPNTLVTITSPLPLLLSPRPYPLLMIWLLFAPNTQATILTSTRSPRNVEIHVPSLPESHSDTNTATNIPELGLFDYGMFDEPTPCT